MTATPADAPVGPPSPLEPVGYQPGLDGLRAVALLAIFVVHANVGLAPGGFLAVSTFFTLSGFLITALVAYEHEHTGRLDIKAFWLRRARRLLPASVVTVALVAVVTLWLGDAGQVANLRGDVIGSLTYVANWRFLFQGSTYAGEFAGQSPLLHFWSLAIEEQFYLLFPLLIGLAFRLRRRWSPAVVVVLVSGIVVSLVAGIVESSGPVQVDKMYFRTDIRMGELLIGALAGLWWVGRGRHLSAPAGRAVGWLGSGLLVAMIALVATSDYHDLFWYRGGLLAYSLVTVGVILGAVQEGSPVHRVLGLAPLVKVGMVSYGAYLVHWPLFLWLDTQTTIPGWSRLLLGTAIALLAAAASHRWIESPVRHRRYRTPVPLLGAGAVLMAFAVLVGAFAPRLAGDKEPSLEQAGVVLADHLDRTAAKPGEAPTIGLFGDSTALMTTLGLAVQDDTDTTIRVGYSSVGLGCTVTVPGHYRSKGRVVRSSDGCTDWMELWNIAASFGDLDLAVVQVGPWEVLDMQPDGTSGFRTIGDPAQDAFLEARLGEALDLLVAQVPLVTVLTSPYIEDGRVNGKSPARPAAENDPVRMDRFNEILTTVAARYPNVAVVDLASWIDEHDDGDLRPDGVHLTQSTVADLSPRFARTFVNVIEQAAGRPPAYPADETFKILKPAAPA